MRCVKKKKTKSLNCQLNNYTDKAIHLHWIIYSLVVSNVREYSMIRLLMGHWVVENNLFESNP